jgi:divalent metal cation (Fe/Co/Zn/Cd) transporter
MTDETPNHRGGLLRRGLRLEIVTVGWNVVEAIIAISAATAAGSVALLGFGADSVIESASGCVLIWRLVAESRATDAKAIEALDQKAHRLVGASLFLLAAFVAIDAGHALWVRDRPEPSRVGIALTLVSLVVMVWLARAKRRAAQALGSRALEADAFQTTACWWLSLITLTGIGLNAVFGWWWADPLAALGMTAFLFQEGREAWRGDKCCP